MSAIVVTKAPAPGDDGGRICRDVNDSVLGCVQDGDGPVRRPAGRSGRGEADMRGGLRMTGHGSAARPQWSARLRAGLWAAAVATALLATVCGGSPASASPAPGRAACTGGYVYWSNTLGPVLKPGDGMIGRACQDGGDVNQKFITGASLPGMILVYRGYLYWANIAPIRNGAGTIGRARLNGTDVNEKFITGASFADGITAAGDYLFWTNHTGTIGRARLDGTDVNQKFIKTAQPNGPDAVVAGSGHLYWANDYNIGRANLNGTGVNQNFIADPKDAPAGLAVNARYIYWTNEYHNTIGRARLNGTEVDQNFITGASFPDAMAASSQYLYWADPAVGGNPDRRAIGRARLNGTDVSQRFIARKDFVNLHGVAVDPGR
jgi:virginiamycin B lyase